VSVSEVNAKSLNTHRHTTHTKHYRHAYNHAHTHRHTRQAHIQSHTQTQTVINWVIDSTISSERHTRWWTNILIQSEHVEHRMTCLYTVGATAGQQRHMAFSIDASSVVQWSTSVQRTTGTSVSGSWWEKRDQL